MIFCCGCVAPQNSEEQPGNEVISLFFRSPNHRRPRMSAEDELSMAVNSLQKQPARRAGAHVCGAGVHRSVMGDPRAVEGVLDAAVAGLDDFGGNGADKGVARLGAECVDASFPDPLRRYTRRG